MSVWGSCHGYAPYRDEGAYRSRDSRLVPRSYYPDRSRRSPSFMGPQQRLLQQGTTSAHPLKSLDQATVFLINHLEKSRDENAETIGSLRCRTERLYNPRDLKRWLHQWFMEFGRTLFAGQITPQNVLLKERDQGFATGRQGGRLDRPGRTYIAGLNNTNMVEIHINTLMLRQHARGIDLTTQAMSILLHQMIHAYLLVSCGTQSDGKDTDGRLKHGEHFAVIMYKLKELSARGGPALTLDFGHNITLVKYAPGRQMYGPGRRLMGSDITKFTDRTCSDCVSNSEGPKEDKVWDWYENKCVKAVDPDVFEYKPGSSKPVATPLSKCGDTKTWVEISFCKKPHKVDRPCINRYDSLKKIFEGANRKLTIPEGVTEESFERMMRFLANDRYIDNNFSMEGKQGPPIIQEYRDSCPKLLMIDIRVYQLGSAIGFVELRRAALGRLKAQPCCYEHPADIMKAIYPTDKQPDKNLQDWAKELMRIYVPIPGHHPYETSNCKTLKGIRDIDEDVSLGLTHEQVKWDLERAKSELEKLPITPFPNPPPAPPPTSWQGQLVHPHWPTPMHPQQLPATAFIVAPDSIVSPCHIPRVYSSSPLRQSWSPYPEFDFAEYEQEQRFRQDQRAHGYWR